jgi:hypothetical protein
MADRTAALPDSARRRLRLRVPGLRHDRDFFGGLSERLQALPGVAGVVANPNTAGVLIYGILNRTWIQSPSSGNPASSNWSMRSQSCPRR